MGIDFLGKLEEQNVRGLNYANLSNTFNFSVLIDKKTSRNFGLIVKFEGSVWEMKYYSEDKIVRRLFIYQNSPSGRQAVETSVM